jgi:soluble lytic murein transglycosylase-like protein
MASAAALAPTTFPTTISPTDAAMLAQAAAANAFKQFVQSAAQQFGFPQAIICGIGSRESGWGLLLKPAGPGGTGDFAPRRNTKPFRPGPLPPDGGGYGRGLMQIDFDAFPFAQTGNWHDPKANIQTGCQVLHSNLVFLSGHTSLQGLMLLRGAIAAYNCGAGNVRNAIQQSRDVDFFTAHSNYSADVLNRAGFFQQQGWV